MTSEATPPEDTGPENSTVSPVRVESPDLVNLIGRDGLPPLAFLVDDDQVFRTVTRAYLEHAGFRVEEAHDGDDAISRFEQVAPDIVVLDILMPGRDGFETCRALRQLPNGRRTPIVVMTGVDDHRSIERAYEVGATDFVNKPLNSFILTHRLQHILRANRYMIQFDDLTGLPRRSLFLERLEMAIAGARRHQHYVAVLYIALDNFKRFNDTMGHRAGDQILCQVSDRLGKLRASDFSAVNAESSCDEPVPAGISRLARFGGDEFMVLLPDIHREKDIAVVAQKVNESLAQPFVLSDREIHVTASIGISAFPLDGTEPELLLERAAVAMNHAKDSGRDRYQFYGEGLNKRTEARLAVECELRNAIEEDRFSVYYQPKVSVQNETVSGVEALVRMTASDGKAVSPQDFIPIAEDSGLIVPLGDWVFRNACEEIAKITVDAEAPITVAINVSACQFRRSDFATRMLEALEPLGLSPERIELELTEGTLLEDSDSSIVTLTALKDLGFRIAVDDFGTGYSSLSYLKRFPLDTLKIDRSFVRDLPGDSSDAAIVEAIIDLGHKLSLEIVAEGVEHRQQLEFLRERGCDVIQGYLFSPALSYEALQEWLVNWESESELAVIRAVRDSLKRKLAEPNED